MTELENIENIYATSANYLDLVHRLTAIGTDSYTVEVSGSLIIYRFSTGEMLIHPGESEPREIAELFDEEATILAIRETQRGNTSYSEFLDGLAKAGVRMYEASLKGPLKKVTYLGIGGSYEEAISTSENGFQE